MPSFSRTSGSAAGVWLVLPLQPNQTPPSGPRSAASTPTANPPGAAPLPGMDTRLETTISRVMPASVPTATTTVCTLLTCCVGTSSDGGVLQHEVVGAATAALQT